MVEEEVLSRFQDFKDAINTVDFIYRQDKGSQRRDEATKRLSDRRVSKRLQDKSNSRTSGQPRKNVQMKMEKMSSSIDPVEVAPQNKEEVFTPQEVLTNIMSVVSKK